MEKDFKTVFDGVLEFDYLFSIKFENFVTIEIRSLIRTTEEYY